MSDNKKNSVLPKVVAAVGVGLTLIGYVATKIRRNTRAEPNSHSQYATSQHDNEAKLSELREDLERTSRRDEKRSQQDHERMMAEKLAKLEKLNKEED